jgi:isopenicillin-N epimerase
MLEAGVTFLNHGSFGAAPRAVFEAQAEWRRRIEASPVELLGRRSSELLATARGAVGAWLGMPPTDFGFTANATEGVNAVLRSLDLSPGDELVTTDHVYNAVRQAMRYVAGRAGATYREVPVPLPVASGRQIEEAVVAGLSPRTRLLVIDHVTSPTALVFPVERIVAACAARGVDVLVDGAHAPGMLPLEVGRIGAAYYAGNLHKWTCAPKGSAFLWVRPDRQAGIHPLVISHHFEEGFVREFGWTGTRDLSAWLTTPRAIEFMAGLGWERVRAHNHDLAAWAHRMLCRRWGVDPVSPPDGSLLGSMAAVPLPPPLDGMTEEQVKALQQRLYTEFRIEVPLMRWGGRNLIRVSCQVYSTAADYLRLADVVDRLARERPADSR